MFGPKVRSTFNLIRHIHINKPWRTIASSTQSHAIVYNQHGDPNQVLEMSITEVLPKDIKSTDVLVRMLAAPVNPADINMIQGVYPVKPDLPAIGGNEGVGEIIDVGGSVTTLKPGDWVVPGESGWGTWRSHAVTSPADMIKVPNDIFALSAATIGVNACTAYRMLKDFVDLQPGDFVIQNGANSGVGQAVIQIAAKFGVRTVNIVRKRDNINELVSALKSFGATHVITDEFVRQKDMKDFMKSIQKPKLALNCVGGKSSAELLKHLSPGGVMVTYGGMSKQPMMVPAGPLIFTDVSLKGYWMTRWNKDHSQDPERQNMWDVLCEMVRNESLKLPLCETVPFKDFKTAVATSMEPFVSRKQILVME